MDTLFVGAFAGVMSFWNKYQQLSYIRVKIQKLKWLISKSKLFFLPFYINDKTLTVKRSACIPEYKYMPNLNIDTLIRAHETFQIIDQFNFVVLL